MPDWFLVLTLLITGFILLIIEFITPGFSIPGTLGILFLGFASYSAFKHLNFASGLLVSAGSIVTVIIFFKLFLRSKAYKRLRLHNSEQGFTSGGEGLKELIGREGVCITALRPSGAGLIAGKRIDVITDGVFIDRNAKIKVVGVEGVKVFVKRSHELASDSEAKSSG